MDRKNVIWLEQPASEWSEALPIGNGRLGAMVFGGVRQERLQLNEDSLWSGEPRPPQEPVAPEVLTEVRRLVFGGQFGEATEACKQLQGAYTQSYLPLGDLSLEFGHGGEAVEEYRRELDLETATAAVSYKIHGVTYTRTMFVSAPDQAVVVRLTANRPGMVALGLSLTSSLRSKTTVREDNALHLNGRAPAHVEPPYRDVEPGIVYDDAENGKGMRFCAMVRPVIENGSMQAMENGLRIDGADSVTLYVTAATSFNGFDKSPSQDGNDEKSLAASAMARVAAKPIAQIQADHRDDYQPYFQRVTLDLGDPGDRSQLATDKRLAALKAGEADPALISLYFQFGRYLLISSSRPGTRPANLQGIWNEEIRPAWSSNYTTNINVQMNYWPSETTNLAELSGPLFDWIEGLRVTGGDAARVYYGAGGWCVHHNSDLWGLANPVGDKTGTPVWANWQMGGAWLCQHLWEHYAFGGDTEFLAERAYPALKGASEFILDHLVESPDGHLTTCPSTSPENTFQYADEDGVLILASVISGATMDIALIHELFGNAITATRILDMDHAFAARLAATLDRLPPFQIGDEGELREWPASVEESDLGQRHISHLYPVYPGYVITPAKSPELANAAKRSLDRRVAHGGGYTGWSRAWLINVTARLGEGDKALHSVHALLADSTYPSLLDAHPPFQIDGNFGGAAGVAEMLLQSHDGAVDLLPALPSAWQAGRVTGIRARGGFDVSMTWNGGVLASAIITAHRAGPCVVRYGGRSVAIDCAPGDIVALNGQLNRE